MKVEVATPDDAPRLAALGWEMHQESSYRDQPYDEAKVRTLMMRLIGGAGVVFVVRRDGQIVGGIAGGVTENWFNDERIAFEYGLFIEPAARHGITAMRIVLAFCKWCEIKGARRVRVGITTGVQVEGTAALYRMCGFVDDGVFLTKEF